MKCHIAKSSGFCMGVRRAVDMALNTSDQQEGPVYTYGPLIHNPQVLDVLEEKGVRVLEQVPECGRGTVLIRAHGVPPEIKQKLRSAGFDTIDATCPRVLKIQTIIKKFADQNHAIVIVGDRDHPEVIGLLGHADGNGYVVEGVEQLRSLPAFEKAIVVAQTTQNMHDFKDLVTWIENHYPHYKIFETICDSTEKRQTEIRKLSQSMDAVVVVGGYGSGNTCRLAEIAAQSGKPVFHVESEEDFDKLDLDKLSSASAVGITAGASTPNWIIKSVCHALQRMAHRQHRSWRRSLQETLRIFLMTNLYVALGASCLTYTCMQLLGLSGFWPCIAISGLYVQSMHLLNNLTGTKADRHNAPDRAFFYEKNRILLSLTAIVTGSAGLLIAYILGVRPFLLILIMTATGMSYNLRILPRLSPVPRIRRLRDVPGSKTLLISLAWGLLAAIMPALAASEHINQAHLLLFTWSAGLVFVRTAFFDVLDMQGDRFVGKETIAILLGGKRMMSVLAVILGILSFLLLVASTFHWISLLGYALVICPLFMLFILELYRRAYLRPGLRLEFLVETVFVLAAVTTALRPMVM